MANMAMEFRSRTGGRPFRRRRETASSFSESVHQPSDERCFSRILAKPLHPTGAAPIPTMLILDLAGLRRRRAKLPLVKNLFWAILFGAALFVPSFGQVPGKNPAITSTTVTLTWDKSPSRAVKGYRL